MRNFEVKAIGLEEMTSNEMISTNGGFGFVSGIVISIVVCAIVDAILDPEAAQNDFDRGREDAQKLLNK